MLLFTTVLKRVVLELGRRLRFVHHRFPSGLKPVLSKILPFVGFQLTVPTVGPHEVRMRVSPGYSSDTAIFSIQSNFVF